MARGIERHFDKYRWMVFGESTDGSKVDIVRCQSDEDVFVYIDKEFAENLVAKHNYHLDRLQNLLVDYGYNEATAPEYLQLSLDLEI